MNSCLPTRCFMFKEKAKLFMKENDVKPAHKSSIQSEDK